MKQTVSKSGQTQTKPRSPRLARPIKASLIAAPVRWKIDELLHQLTGQPVRVAAEGFAPIGPDGNTGRLTPVTHLILPDNSRPEGLPVFFEGILHQASRQIGVVHVRLGGPSNKHPSAQGRVPFRDGLAIILRGPAIVRLAVPFHIERLPGSERNYWRDLQFSRAQFLLSLESES